MFNFSLEFDNEVEIRETTRRLLAVHGVTGEIGCHRLQNGRWRLDVMSERDLTEGLLDSLKGRKVSQPADGSGD